MIRRALAITCSLWLAEPALAQTPPGAGGPMLPVIGSVSPTGSLPFTPTAVINVVDPPYNAKCDAQVTTTSGVLVNPSTSTDDTAAINAAIVAWYAAGAKGAATLSFPQNGFSCKTTGPINFTRANSSSPYGMTVDHLSIIASFSSNGPIGTVTIGAAGSGGTPGTYTNVALTGGTGAGCVATSVVVGAGGTVTSAVLTSPGCGSGYAYGDTLSAASGDIGGTTGLSLTLNSISGGAAVDAIGTRWIHWNNATVYGDCTSSATTPNVGMAIGRVLDGASAGSMNFNAPMFNGCFALTPFYNLASEVNHYAHPQFYDLKTTGTTWVAILDGDNHWNWSSSFRTLTPPLDTRQSFIGNDFDGLLGQTNLNVSGGYGIWAENIKQNSFHSSYIAATQYPFVLYFNVNDPSYSNLFDVHVETSALIGCFLITGPNPTPKLLGLTYIDETSNCQTSVFAADTGVTSVGLYDLRLHVDLFSGGSTTVFDNPSLYSGSGNVFVPAAANWSAPIGWNGQVCILSACYPIVPTQAINRNPDFVIDQKFAGGANAAAVAAAMIVDGWHQFNVGGVANIMTYTRTSSAPPNGYAFSELMTTRVATTPTATQFLSARTTIEGTNAANFNWGTAQAIPATLDFCAKASNTGTYTWSIQNAGLTLSYLVDYTITAANTWQCFNKTIPAITTGTWNTIQDTTGIYLMHSITAGSNLLGTNGVWNSGAFYADSNTFNLAATLNNTLNIAAVHLRPGPVDMTYQPKPVAQELVEARHWYLKSFNTRTAAAQNAGATGAVTIDAPYAFATNALISTYVNFGGVMFSLNNTGAPTVTFYSTTAASGNCYNSARSQDSGVASAINVGDNGMTVQCTLIVGDLLGNQEQVHFDVDSGF